MNGNDDALIAAYLDDTLGTAEREAFDQRLSSEPALARRFAGHLLLDGELRSLRASPAAKPRRRQRRTARTWIAPLLAAAAALVAAVLWLAWPTAAPTPAASGVDIVVLPGQTAGVTVAGYTQLPAQLEPGRMLRTTQTVLLRWRGETTEVQVIPTSGAAEVQLDAQGLELAAGAVEVAVEPRGSGQPFRVLAGEAVATVLGTRFRVERVGPRTLLRVAAGRVELRQGARALQVEAGASAVADADRVALDPTATLNDGLLARWSGESLEGSGVLRDLGPGGHVGSAQGVRVIPGRRGQALQFAGERSTVLIPHAEALDIGDPAKPFTLALWMRTPGAVANDGTLLGKGRNAATPGPTLAIVLGISPSSTIDIYRWTDRSTPNMESHTWPAAGMYDGAWHHVAVVGEHASLRRCYYDGVLIGTDTGTWHHDTRNASPWSIGRIENQGFTGEFPFTGDLEDIRIYDRALTPGEVAMLGAE